MNHAISPATPNAARMGIAKIAGVPISPAKISDNTVVGSNVNADTCMDDEDDDEIITSSMGRADTFVDDEENVDVCIGIIIVSRPGLDVVDDEGRHVKATIMDDDDDDHIVMTATKIAAIIANTGGEVVRLEDSIMSIFVLCRCFVC